MLNEIESHALPRGGEMYSGELRGCRIRVHFCVHTHAAPVALGCSAPSVVDATIDDNSFHHLLTALARCDISTESFFAPAPPPHHVVRVARAAPRPSCFLPSCTIVRAELLAAGSQTVWRGAARGGLRGIVKWVLLLTHSGWAPRRVRARRAAPRRAAHPRPCASPRPHSAPRPAPPWPPFNRSPRERAHAGLAGCRSAPRAVAAP